MKRVILFTIFLLVGLNSAALAERLAVAVPEANIRSGPGIKYDKIWKVGKYHPLNIIKKEGVWYGFRDFEGDEGWIHKKLLKKISTVITKNNDISNVRIGPGLKNDIVFTVEKGVPFKVLERRGAWVRILHADGDKGWIHKKLVW
jgi:SH3-like domain-containing protein